MTDQANKQAKNKGGRPAIKIDTQLIENLASICLLYTSPSPRDRTRSRMPSSA